MGHFVTVRHIAYQLMYGIKKSNRFTYGMPALEMNVVFANTWMIIAGAIVFSLL